MFRQAHNIVITGGTFTDIETNHDAVSTILWPHVAAGAIFDSAERYPAGRCHPGTRQRMIGRITDWIEEPHSMHRILWLHGPAGAGKSALMQAICELLRDSDPGSNSGSFFFSRGHTDCGKARKLFVTLSYQLAVRFPSLRARINDTLGRDPSLPTKSLDIQLRFLIINPLLRCEDFLSQTPILFIDGLDECDNDQGVNTQCQIISLVSKFIVDKRIPIRFIIASRPEYWIRDAFEAAPASDLTFTLSLRDDIDVDKDIRAYLTDGFEEIRLEKRWIMESVLLSWPPTYVVDRFVHDASGQYIYASTILKFVGALGSPFSDPKEQLGIIITPGPDRTPAFTELDRLYATILSVYPRWETMKRVLGGLLADVDLTVIRVVLGVPQTEIANVLVALSSLIDVLPESESIQGISFCHLSFREFLRDEMRSGLYYIDISPIRIEVLGALVGIFQRSLEQNYEQEPWIYFNISPSQYETMMKSIAWSNTHEICDLMTSSGHDTTKRFRRVNPGRYMRHPPFLHDTMITINITLCESYRSRVDLQHDFSTFLQLTKHLDILTSVARDRGYVVLPLGDRSRTERILSSVLYYIDMGWEAVAWTI